MDKTTHIGIMSATISIYDRDTLINTAETDLNGYYYFDTINSGKYNIETSIIGYKTITLKEVVIYSYQQNTIDLFTEIDTTTKYNPKYIPPLIRSDIRIGSLYMYNYENYRVKGNLVPAIESALDKKVTADEIKNLPMRNINGLKSTKALCGSSDSELIRDHMTPKEKRKQQRKRARAEEKKHQLD